MERQYKEQICSSTDYYHTNACCNPEYAKRGMISSIRTSARRVVIDFDKDTKYE